ncbi:uncharacterized protein LOC122642800 [Telopea speciosissima]|uniref:uncharacterized protein LOC122642800 n=1 Tax=Telopea speciosissima TaxID=54955 RepID=UPI001CC6B1B0|nr:uncharacterized protein LOC122642800 [Telopea speciosissima]
MKNDLAFVRDESENYMSHIAAKKAPIQRLNQIPGAALQMQRELLWYKEVESVMFSIHEMAENKQRKTPRILFTEEHRDLLKDGATWMKDTSTQCMVIATLITTIMFAAVFTVPGHGGGGGGEPNNYIQGKFQLVFNYHIKNVSTLFFGCCNVDVFSHYYFTICGRRLSVDFASDVDDGSFLSLHLDSGDDGSLCDSCLIYDSV